MEKIKDFSILRYFNFLLYGDFIFFSQAIIASIIISNVFIMAIYKYNEYTLLFTLFYIISMFLIVIISAKIIIMTKQVRKSLIRGFSTEIKKENGRYIIEKPSYKYRVHSYRIGLQDIDNIKTKYIFLIMSFNDNKIIIPCLKAEKIKKKLKKRRIVEEI